MHHARQHAETKTRERRYRLAREAARLMAESGVRDFHQAKLKAAERLGIHDDASLPRNREIEEALREYQRLFQGGLSQGGLSQGAPSQGGLPQEAPSDGGPARHDQGAGVSEAVPAADARHHSHATGQPAELRRRREAALRALEFFADFDPRLVGPVLDGTADAYSAVQLHLHCDDAEAVAHFLDDHRIPAESRSRRLRLDRERTLDCPVWLFSAEDLGFDLTVLPYHALRQAPLSPVDERPMRRAGIGALRTVLASE